LSRISSPELGANTNPINAPMPIPAANANVVSDILLLLNFIFHLVRKILNRAIPRE
jgi:hypothetical protein